MMHARKRRGPPAPKGKPKDAKALAAARESSGLAQAQAADVLGISVRTWQEWEQGRRPVPGMALELFKIKTGQVKARMVR
jgi:putative transcriptional regulator